ncbi:hypothetical protein BMJ21_03325, partial [Sinorhizobium medicae]
RLAGNLTTLQQEAAEQGRDWKMDAQQRARERAFYERLGLDPDPGKPEARSQASAAPPAEPGDEAEEEVNGRTSARRHPAGIPRISRRKSA